MPHEQTAERTLLTSSSAQWQKILKNKLQKIIILTLKNLDYAEYFTSFRLVFLIKHQYGKNMTKIDISGKTFEEYFDNMINMLIEEQMDTCDKLSKEELQTISNNDQSKDCKDIFVKVNANNTNLNAAIKEYITGKSKSKNIDVNILLETRVAEAAKQFSDKVKLMKNYTNINQLITATVKSILAAQMDDSADQLANMIKMAKELFAEANPIQKEQIQKENPKNLTYISPKPIPNSGTGNSCLFLAVFDSIKANGLTCKLPLSLMQSGATQSNRFSAPIKQADEAVYKSEDFLKKFRKEFSDNKGSSYAVPQYGEMMDTEHAQHLAEYLQCPIIVECTINDLPAGIQAYEIKNGKSDMILDLGSNLQDYINDLRLKDAVVIRYNGNGNKGHFQGIQYRNPQSAEDNLTIADLTLNR